MADPSTNNRKKLEISPADIVFDLSQREPYVELTITNRFDEQLAFKVKTTQPKRYLVRPNVDVVDDTHKVRIIMQSRHAFEVYEEYKNTKGIVKCEDLFLVQGVVISEEHREIVEASRKDAKRLSNVLQEMWKTKKKSDFTNKKLRCKLQIPQEEPEWYKKVAQLQAAKEQENVIKATQQTSEMSSRTVTTNNNTPVSTAVKTQATSDDTGNMAELQRKYNELTTLVVRMTGERDQYKESYDKKCEEVKVLQQKLNQGTPRGVENLNGQVSKQSYVVWQFLVLAVIAVLVARLLV